MNLFSVSKRRALVGAIASVALVAGGAIASAPTASAEGDVVASNYTYSTYMNQTYVQGAPGVLSTVTAPAGTTLTAALQTPPTRGTVQVNPDGSFTYTPPLNFTGAETWQYNVIDGIGGRDIGTVTMNVRSVPPNAINDAYSVAPGLFLNQAAPGVLSNDTDPSGNPLALDSVTQPTHGSLVAYTDGSFTYISDPGYLGTDTWTYQMTNGFTRATATVTMTVAPSLGGSDAPAAGSGEAVSGSLPKLPAATGVVSGATASTFDLTVKATKKRTANRTYVVTAKVRNVGLAATGRAVVTKAGTSKGVTVTKVKAPKGWTCKTAKNKRTSTCTFKKGLAANALATITYTLATTPGKVRTVRIAAATAAPAVDPTPANNTVLVKVPAKK